MFNREELEKAINRSGLNDGFIAKEIGISYDLFSKKKSGVTEWKLKEVQKLCHVLHLRQTEARKIFPLKVNKEWK